MADFVFGDFSEQETEKFFGHDKQSVKVNEPEVLSIILNQIKQINN